jgi:multisubunit Na+/H+ antiporter MnhE subunit
MSRRVLHFAGWWAACYVLWLALTDTVAGTELVTGVAASALAAGTASLVYGRDRAPMRWRAAWLRDVARLPWRIVVDTTLVTLALFRRTRGRFVTVDAGLPRTEDEARGFMTFGTLLGSIAPNRYVIDVDDRKAVVHELVRTKTLSSLDDVLR